VNKLKPEDAMVKEWSKIFNLTPGMLAHERIENTAANGTPDYAYCIDGINGWIEFKVHAKPRDIEKRIAKVKHWKGLQREWMRARYSCPTVFLFLRVRDIDYIFNTNTMFTFEKEQYTILMEDHPTKYDNTDLKGNVDLFTLRNILRGVKYNGE